MKKSTKMIAMLTVMALLIGLLAAAIADDKIFTSSVFKIPKNRIDSEMLEQALELQEEQAEDEPEEEDEEDPDEDEPEEDELDEDELEEDKPKEKKKSSKKKSKSEEAETEQSEEAEDADGPVERKVKIHSSRKDIVIKNEIITLTSELIGFEGVTVHYQWQVDRGDGEGWVDVEGATGPTHDFIARPDTILYNWRLSVTVDE